MTWQIEPIPPAQTHEGLALIVGAGRSGPDVTAAAAALETYIEHENRNRCFLWWSGQHSPSSGAFCPLAAALAICSPGRTAVI
ncbi:MAG: hypothetical protein HQ546_09395, partial [Planctomycetes bacterium]|nr:hypothetical protein [Planctomycetota bacterium]